MFSLMALSGGLDVQPPVESLPSRSLVVRRKSDYLRQMVSFLPGLSFSMKLSRGTVCRCPRVCGMTVWVLEAYTRGNCVQDRKLEATPFGLFISVSTESLSKNRVKHCMYIVFFFLYMYTIHIHFSMSIAIQYLCTINVPRNTPLLMGFVRPCERSQKKTDYVTVPATYYN